jgi:hypothetical protein
MKKLAYLWILLLVAASTSLGGETWEELSDEDGIKVWRREVEGSPVVAFKGETVIPASLAKVASVLDDTSRKGEWVANLLEAKDVKIISPTERIEYNRTDAPWPVSDRDFVFRADVKVDKAARTLYVLIKSTTDASCPVDEEMAVRGELLDSKYTLTLLDDGRTRVIVEIQVDPKGSVPKWVVNWAQKGWPRKTLEGIRGQCKKADVKELALVKEWLAEDKAGAGVAVAAISSQTKNKN